MAWPLLLTWRVPVVQYTPLSFVRRKGCIMNNASAEIASADRYRASMRLFAELSPANVSSIRL